MQAFYVLNYGKLVIEIIIELFLAIVQKNKKLAKKIAIQRMIV